MGAPATSIEVDARGAPSASAINVQWPVGRSDGILEKDLEMAVFGLLDDPDLEPRAVGPGERQPHGPRTEHVRPDAHRTPRGHDARFSDEEGLAAVREGRGREQERRRDCGGAREDRPKGSDRHPVTATA